VDWSGVLVYWHPGRSCGVNYTAIKWDLLECERTAREIFKRLPDGVHDLLDKPFRGVLINLSAEMADIATPTATDIANNYPFLQPICKQFPHKVPSAYAIADILLILDMLCGGNLLTPNAKFLTKTDVALNAAGRIKRLMGTLRHLRRKSEHSYSSELDELKSLLIKKPTSKDAAADAAVEAEAAAEAAVDETDEGLVQMLMDYSDCFTDEQMETYSKLLPEMSSPHDMILCALALLGEKVDEVGGTEDTLKGDEAGEVGDIEDALKASPLPVKNLFKQIGDDDDEEDLNMGEAEPAGDDVDDEPVGFGDFVDADDIESFGTADEVGGLPVGLKKTKTIYIYIYINSFLFCDL